MTPKERAAMQQALEALEEMFHSNSTKVAVEKYNTAHNALREALDHFRDATKKVAEQAEQEPVAWLRPACVDNFATHNYKTCERTDYGAFPTYAAPVRTKDLTEEDLCEIEQKCGYISHDNIRKIIALYEGKKNG